jgi:hypothetical protein
MYFTKITGLATLTATLLLGAGALAPNRAAADDADDPLDLARLCLTVADGNQQLFQLNLRRGGLLHLEPGATIIVRGNLNGLEPAVGAAFNPGSGLLVINLQGTVAGFFTGMQLKYNPATGTGTARVVGELTAHPKATLSQTSCP